MAMQMKACHICYRSRHLQNEPHGDFHDELVQINRGNINNTSGEHCLFF